MSRVYSVQAIVLRRRNLAETDKIITLFTRERGALSAVAKGARRPQSRIAGATEPPLFLRASMAVGLNLDILTQCEVREAFPSLRSNLARVTTCSYLLETTETLLEERQPQPDLFDLLLSALYLLNAGAEPEPITAGFSIHTAEIAGFGPSLERCARCHEPIGEGAGGYSVTLGGAVCRVCRPNAKDAVRFPETARQAAMRLSTLELPVIARLDWNVSDVRGLTRLMRRHTEFRTERKLKSAEFLEALRVRDPAREEIDA